MIKKLLIILSLLLGLPLVVFGAIQFNVDTGGTLTNFLQSYYQMEDTTDFFGSTNLNQSANLVAFTAGKIGNAADSGSTDNNKILVSSSTASAQQNIDGGSVTLNAWIKPNVALGGQARAVELISKGTGTDYYFDVRSTGVNIVREKYNVATQTVSTTTALSSTSTFYMVTLRYSSTSSILEGLINNQTVGTTTASGNGNSVTCSALMVLGLKSCDDVNVLKWLGKVDMLGVWNRSLTNAEITDLYNGGAGDDMANASGTTAVGRKIKGHGTIGTR